MSKLRHPAIEPTHPGAILREDVFPALDVSKVDFAKALGVSRQTVYNLLDCKQRVTAEIAVRLEAVVGGSAAMWTNLQADHDLWHARRELAGVKLKKLAEVA